MSTQIQRRTTTPLVLVLLGAVISLSSLPGHDTAVDAVTQPSLEYAATGNCDAMASRMAGSDDDDHCRLDYSTDGGVVEGQLNVTQEEIRLRDAKGDLSPVTTTHWKGILKLSCKDEDCGEVETPIYADKANFAAIVQKAKEQAKAQTPQMIAKLKQAKAAKDKEAKKQKRIANCEIDKNGKDLSESATVSCQTRRMKNMDDEEA
jgi:hypothetical protein